MRLRSLLLVTLCAIPTLLLLSCSGGGGQKSQSSTQSRVEGYVFVSPGGTITLGRSTTPPAGTSPLPGATVTAEGVSGGSTTGTNGFFRLSNLEPGNYQLKVQGAASATAPITLFGSATTTVGEPTFSRSQAIDAVRARLAGVRRPAEAALFSPSQPLPVGTTVTPGMEERATPLFRADRPTWFFYADLSPTAKFSHAVKYYFVDAESGAVTEEDADSWPAINNRFYYYDDSEYDTGQDLIQKSSLAIGRSRSRIDAAIAEVRRSSTASVTRDHHVDACTDGGKVHVLLIQGDPRSDVRADMDMYSKLAKDQFRAAKVVEYRPAQVPAKDAPDALLTIRSKWAEVKQGLRPCDTLFVMISTHGEKDGRVKVFGRAAERPSPGKIGPNAVLQGEDAKFISLPSELDLLSTNACHVIVQLLHCHSGKTLADYQKLIEEDITGRIWGKKIVILAEAAADEWGFGRPDAQPPPGNYFGTEMFNEYVAQWAATPPTSLYNVTVEGASSAFDKASVRSHALTQKDEKSQDDGRLGANPVKYIRIPPPYESCGAAVVSGIRAGVDLRNGSGQLVFPAGTPIGLFQLEGYHESEKEEPVTAERGCSERHLHANTTAGVKVKDLWGKELGTIPDPRKTTCGYGAIIQVTVAELFAKQP